MLGDWAKNLESSEGSSAAEQDLQAIQIQQIHDVKHMLGIARGMEESSVKDYNKFANECSANADSATKKVFEDLGGDE